MIDELINQVKGLSKSDLNKLSKALEEKLSEYDFSEKKDFSAFIYNGLIHQLYRKFPARQVDWCKNWTQLKLVRKKEFIKHWLGALKVFTDLGFDNNKKLHDLVIKLAMENPVFSEQGCTFGSLLVALDEVDEAFDRAFPDYIHTGAIELLIKKLKNETDQTTINDRL